jgi:hypothetical protein
MTSERNVSARGHAVEGGGICPLTGDFEEFEGITRCSRVADRCATYVLLTVRWLLYATFVGRVSSLRFFQLSLDKMSWTARDLTPAPRN